MWEVTLATVGRVPVYTFEKIESDRSEATVVLPYGAPVEATMKVRDQLGFALSVRKWSRLKINQRVDELAELLAIEPLLERNLHGHPNLDISGITTNDIADHARTFLKFDNGNRHWTLF